MMKSKFRLLTLFVVMVLCFSSLSVTAFAGGDGETTEPPTITEPSPDPAPLTPEGNLTLVDDIEGDETQGKQFVTLQSKAGNYFYLVIDRDGDKENVYFLNLVDEADLMALIEETPVTPEEVPEPEPTPEPEVTEPVEEQPEESGNPAMLILAVLLIAGALCAGNPLIKERMDLDVEVAKLKLLKASHQSVQYRLEDNLLKHFPEEIERNKGFITGFKQDLITFAEHTPKEPLPTAEGQIELQGETTLQADKTPSISLVEMSRSEFKMTVKGDVLTDKDNAGAAILAACAEVKKSEPVEIGTYKGFTMLLSYEAFGAKHKLTLKGAMSYTTDLGLDARGNLLRIDNTLESMEKRLTGVEVQLENLYKQMENAKSELGKPFLQEDELKEKSARLAQLDAELNLGGNSSEHETDSDIDTHETTDILHKKDRPSVLDSLKQLPQKGGETPKKSKSEREER